MYPARDEASTSSLMPGALPLPVGEDADVLPLPVGEGGGEGVVLSPINLGYSGAPSPSPKGRGKSALAARFSNRLATAAR
jgi:hypothetical protein